MEREKEHVLKTLLVLIWLLLLIHMAAEYYYLYWKFRWFDLVTHFLGGLWVGVLGNYLIHFSKHVPGWVRVSGWGAALMVGIVIGFLWEFYEYVVWLLSGNGLPVNYVGDSLLDLVMDVSGAFSGYFLYRAVTRKTKQNPE